MAAALTPAHARASTTRSSTAPTSRVNPSTVDRAGEQAASTEARPREQAREAIRIGVSEAGCYLRKEIHSWAGPTWESKHRPGVHPLRPQKVSGARAPAWFEEQEVEPPAPADLISFWLYSLHVTDIH